MKRWQVDSTLLVVVMLWGSTFFVVHDATKLWSPVAFVALRFGLASLALLPWVLRSLRQWTRDDVRAGVILGLLLTAGYITQTIGISLTTASRSGFITGLNVVMVPLIGALLLRTRVRGQVWMGVLLAVAGLLVLSLDKGAADAKSSWLGDGLVFLCAITFAGHILAVGHWSRGRSLVAINFIQMATVAVLAAIGSLLFETTPAMPSAAVWWAALYLGVICTALLLAIQVVAQRYASPTHTAMIFVLEPVFAAIFAALFGGEILTMLLIWGGLLMMSGIILAELPSLRPKVAGAAISDQ